MKILVTGCGRAGTQFTARLLSLAGLRVSHERVHDLELDPLGEPPRAELARRWQGVDADVSWLAAPFLACQPGDVQIWHQLRNPLHVVQCWRSHDLLTMPKHHAGRYAQMVVRCDVGLALERAVAYVYGWTSLILQAKAHRTYRVEDMTGALLADLLSGAGREPGDTDSAVASVSRTTGTCPDGMHLFTTWDDVIEMPYGEELYEQSVRLGYGEG